MKLILFVYTHTESEYTAPAAAGKYRQKPTQPGWTEWLENTALSRSNYIERLQIQRVSYRQSFHLCPAVDQKSMHCNYA